METPTLPLRLAQIRFLGYTCGEKGRTLRFFLNAMIWKNGSARRITSLGIMKHDIPRYVFPCTLLALVTLLGDICSRLDAADAQRHIWLIDTRSASLGEESSNPQSFRYWQLDQEGAWQSVDAKAFRATDSKTEPTVVFIPGNLTTFEQSVYKAWYAYDLIREASCGQAFRFVIWSWPADRVCRRLTDDFRLKADDCNDESVHLAHWLNQVEPGVRVSLVGHSFGPRIITGALHLLGGGELAGWKLPADTAKAWAGGKRNSIRAVLLAAAVDADCLAPDGCHHLALSVAEELLVTCNANDVVLRRYPRIDTCGGCLAMGSIGPRCAAEPAKIRVIDVAAAVGVRHSWQLYCSAVDDCGQWPRYTFLDARAK